MVASALVNSAAVQYLRNVMPELQIIDGKSKEILKLKSLGCTNTILFQIPFIVFTVQSAGKSRMGKETISYWMRD